MIRRTPALFIALSALGAAAAGLAPLPASAQLAGFGEPLAEADMLYMAGEPRASFDRIEAHLATDSTDYGALWRAARAAVVLGIEGEGSREQNAWLDPAMAYGNLAVEVRPDGVDGIYWRGVAAGRRAMNASPGYAVELAQIVYEDAHTILAADSTHGGAHNMLGKLNYEIMTVSGIERFIARTFMGNDALDDTSWEQAEHHLRRAVEAWPDFVLFHFDLGQLHRRRDRREAAIREFAHALALTPTHPTDVGLQEQARGHLDEWEVSTDSLVVCITDHGPVDGGDEADTDGDAAEPGPRSMTPDPEREGDAPAVSTAEGCAPATAGSGGRPGG